MPADLLDQVQGDLRERLDELAPAVSEASRLEVALAALNEVPASGSGASVSGNGRRRGRPNGSTSITTAKGTPKKRRSRSAPGANDALVIGVLEGESDAYTILAVAEKTGLTITTAGYTLNRLHAAGRLKRKKAKVKGERGPAKVFFSLTERTNRAPGAAASSNGSSEATEATQPEAAGAPATPKAKAAKPRKARKARKAAGRKASPKAPTAAPAESTDAGAEVAPAA